MILILDFTPDRIVAAKLMSAPECAALWVQLRAVAGCRWSELAVWLLCGGHLPSEARSECCSPLMMLFLGWLTSQLTRLCFISFLGINVCLCISSKAEIQGSWCGWEWSGSSKLGSSSGSSRVTAGPIWPRDKHTPAVRCQRNHLTMVTWEGLLGRCVLCCVGLFCVYCDSWMMWNLFTAQLTSSK